MPENLKKGIVFIRQKISYFFSDVLHWRLWPTMVAMTVMGIVLLLFIHSLNRQLFFDPYSTVVFDRNGELLGARIADDGQWRFPAADSVPDKFKQCIILFEDRYFYRHPGFNPLSLLRAAYQNFMSGEIVSGGSTITMQTIRLSRKGKPRTIPEKIIEIILSLHLEVAKSKQEILSLYVSHAPYGGNVVGLNAAAWRYYGRSPDNLSWAEAATLAVLPNAPALIHPGRNREALKNKRDRLLRRLVLKGVIDAETYRLSIHEPLPGKPLPLPNPAPHLTARMDRKRQGKIILTTVDLHLQHAINSIVERYRKNYRYNGIHNAAVMVMEIESGEVLAYVGNTRTDGSGDHGNEVDVTISPRSSGSILKPLLYACMLGDGEILPGTLIADIPTTIGNYSPKNFNVVYDGAVPASEALIRSLNVPAVRMLVDYGLGRFYDRLKSVGFSTLRFSADHYGLSLILGGAEVTLWDLCKIYGGMGYFVNHCHENDLLSDQAFPEPLLRKDDPGKRRVCTGGLHAGAVYTMLEAMREVRRPDAEAGWESFLSSFPVAWKTGTSFGFRDAWAVGLTPGYVVGVWVGNADGEGRPELTGLKKAAPLMFEVFDLLPASGWFEPPWDEMTQTGVCKKSGMRTSKDCPETDSIWIPETASNAGTCPYHRMVHLDSTGRYRVHADCYPASLIKTKPWFVLPPAMAWFYRSVDPFYRGLPQWLPGCENTSGNPMQLIWPDKYSKIYIPRELDGSLGKAVFEIAHNKPSNKVFWYIDEEYAGTTVNMHKLGLQPDYGRHVLTLVDEEGHFLRTTFEIVSRKK